VGFAATAAIILALSAGVVVSAWQAVRARKAEKLAKERLAEVGKERDAKDLARQDAEAVSKFLSEVFQSPDPTRDGRTITVAETLDKAAKKLESDLATQPARRANLQGTLGVTYFGLGLYREAIALQEKVRDYDLATFGPEHLQTLWAMDTLAIYYDQTGRKDEALKMHEEVVTLERKVLGPEHPQTLEAMSGLAYSYASTGRRDEAVKLSEEVVALERKVRGPEHDRTLNAMNTLAISYANAGRLDEAIKLWEEVLRVSRKVLGAEHPFTLQTMHNLAASYAGRRPDDALKLYEESLRLMRKVIGAEHPYTLTAMEQVALFYVTAGRRDEALKLWQGAEDALAVCAKQNPNSQQIESDYAQVGLYLAIDYLWLGRTNEHQAICRKLLELAAHSQEPTIHERAAKACLIQPHPDPNLLKLAVASGRQALALSPPNDANRPWFLIIAGLAEVRDAKPAEAEPLLTEALKHINDNDDQNGLALAFRTIALVQLGHTNEARTDFAALEKLALPLPTHDSSLAGIGSDHLAVCIAYEEARAVLNAPAVPHP
jgi:tetratricopeptide (TPR) repeat protein